MSGISAYLELMKKHPEWFANTGEAGEIKIITDGKRIRSEQRKIRSQLKKEGKPAHWIDIGILAEDQWFYVLRDMVEFPDGQVGGYIRWINRKSAEGGGFNVVLMCVLDEKVLLIRKFRHEVRAWSWEFPRGFGEAGLTAEETALMELREEIGVSHAELTCLTMLREGRGGTAAFLAKIPDGSQVMPDAHEGIQTYRWVPRHMLEEMIKNGQLQDSFSLWTYLLAKLLSLY
jgi:ADP-ribose pyrophosphatase